MSEIDWAAMAEAVNRMAHRCFGMNANVRPGEVEAVVRPVLWAPRDLLAALEEGLVTEEEVAGAVGGHLHAWLVDRSKRSWEESSVGPEDPFVPELQAVLFAGDEVPRRWRAGGPYHEFVPLPASERARACELTPDTLPEHVRVSDDVINYVWDSLDWIPSALTWDNPDWPGRGLDHWGMTLIDARGATTAERVFAAWAALFSAGPAEIELRCDLFVGEDDRLEEGTVVVERDEVVEQMRTIAGYFARCVGGEWIVLHRGV
jgi:hypothetical protein